MQLQWRVDRHVSIMYVALGIQLKNTLEWNYCSYVFVKRKYILGIQSESIAAMEGRGVPTYLSQPLFPTENYLPRYLSQYHPVFVSILSCICLNIILYLSPNHPVFVSKSFPICQPIVAKGKPHAKIFDHMIPT